MNYPSCLTGILQAFLEPICSCLVYHIKCLAKVLTKLREKCNFRYSILHHLDFIEQATDVSIRKLERELLHLIFGPDHTPRPLDRRMSLRDR